MPPVVAESAVRGDELPWARNPFDCEDDPCGLQPEDEYDDTFPLPAPVVIAHGGEEADTVGQLAGVGQLSPVAKGLDDMENLIAVLDIDSDRPAAFDEDDAAALEAILTSVFQRPGVA